MGAGMPVPARKARILVRAEVERILGRTEAGHIGRIQVRTAGRLLVGPRQICSSRSPPGRVQRC